MVRMWQFLSEKARPRRILSFVTKSHAFTNNLVGGRIVFGIPFFFPLVETAFSTEAFCSPGPEKTKDENKFHHPYFLRELKKLVESATAAGIQIKQRVHWSSRGQWLSLDDGRSTGVEPDFCTSELYLPGTTLVPDPVDGAVPPLSKYDVEITFEAKKGFTDADQIEAIDYTERVMCMQRGRSEAYGALFHCCGNEKVIRWIRTREGNEGFTYQITTAAKLGPGELGSKQLLTMLTKTRLELGRPFPSRITPIGGGDEILFHMRVGEGATSNVYSVSRGNNMGVVKYLHPGFATRAEKEVNVLQHMTDRGVETGIVAGELVGPSTIYFPKLLKKMDFVSRNMSICLFSILETVHAAGVIHRDLRPDNIMADAEGMPFFIDWGCSCITEELTSAPPFEGTFRFASAAALSAAISETDHIPKASDDLESLVRSLLAMNSPDLLYVLGKIEVGDFFGAQKVWDERSNGHFEDLFNAARRLDYEYLKKIVVN
jgi:hypothetical protein